MSALFLTADLMFSSRVAGTARQLGVRLTVVPSPAACIERCESEAVALLLVDLSLPNLNIADLAATLRALPNPPMTLIAYAPHVHENLLAEATAAGCTEVLSRGQFSGKIEPILTSYT